MNFPQSVQYTIMREFTFYLEKKLIIEMRISSIFLYNGHGMHFKNI